jgi:hypothetical protein
VQAEAPVAPDTPPDPLTTQADLTDDRLRLKQAATLFQGGLLAEAETLLAAPLLSAEPVLRDRYNLMRARIFAATQRHADVLATWMTAPNTDYLRLRAEAAFALAEWDAARQSYETLSRSMGSAMPAGDRINLLLATYRSGDSTRLQDLLRSFPELGADWAALAAGLTVEAQSVLPLRTEIARERVENAETALRALQAAGGGAMP